MGLSHDDWTIGLRYEFGDALTVHVTVQNLGHISRSFELALHSYFAVGDVTSVEIEGLNGLTYLDKTRGNGRFTQDGAVHFAGEVDRIYLSAPSSLRIREGIGGYRLEGNWKSAVTWNPGAVKAATMNDIGEEEWKNFVCLEVGVIADDAVGLGPQQTWSMSATVSRI